MIHGCGRPLRMRGLCNGCYTLAQMVRESETTMDRLERLGLILPAKTRVPGAFRLAVFRNFPCCLRRTEGT